MTGQQVVSGLGWTATASAASAACQLVLVVVLARLLDPAAFGLMALAVIALRFVSFFAHTGLAQAIVQQPRLTTEDTTAALTLSLGVSLAVYAAIALAAAPLGDAFESPELPSLIRALGLSLVLGALGSLPLALLRRQARFKRVSGIELFSFVFVHATLAIACASLGMGVWSLVVAALGQQAAILVLSFQAVRYPLAWPVTQRSFSRLWAGGSRHSLIGFLEFLHAQAESLVIGRAFGQVDLGLFNRATALTNLPVEFAVGAVGKVMFPALAASQHDRARVADGFQMLLLGIGLLAAALASGIAAAAPDVVALLLGPRWLDSAPIVAIVAFSVPPMFMYVACGVTLDSLGALGPKLRLQSLMLLFKVSLLVLLARWGWPGVAYAVVLAEAARLGLGMRLTGRLLGIAPARLWRALTLPAAVGLAVWLAVGVAMALGHAAGLPLPGRVLIECLAGATVLLAGLLLFVLRFPAWAPLQRFDPAQRWHGRLLAALRVRALRP